MILQDICPRFHRLPATHRSTYSLMATLHNLGFDPLVASTAIDLMLGPDPERVLEHWEDEPLDGLPDEFPPPPEALDWLAPLDAREAAMSQARQDDRFDAMTRLRRNEVAL